jgi:Domain of unknown function (DUF4294)
MANNLTVREEMKKIFFVAVLYSVMNIFSAKAQSEIYGQPYTIYNGDTIQYYSLPMVDIVDYVSPNAKAEVRKYLKLRRDVLRVYPYAKLAAAELKFINDSMANIKNERAQKKFVKQREDELKAKFEAELKKLTMTQGRILIKLIDRETGNTSYALVKELRGNLSAFFWQGLARLFGSSLKSQYDAAGEDAGIEQIVQAIERGELSVVKK